MIKNPLLKKVSLLTALVLLFTSFGPLNNLVDANEVQKGILDDVLASETVESLSTGVDLDKNVLSDNFDLEEEVENMPSVNEMNSNEKEIFDLIVEEQVALAGLESAEEEKLFAEALVSFFSKDSETYNNLGLSLDRLEENIEKVNISKENITSGDQQESFIKTVLDGTLGIKTAHAFKVRVGVKFAGAVFNTIIGFAIGGGVGAIQAFIIKKGKKEAKRIFTRTVVTKLKAWGAPKLALAVGSAVSIALNYADVGTQIAKQLDKRDKRPNNGWIDLY